MRSISLTIIALQLLAILHAAHEHSDAAPDPAVTTSVVAESHCPDPIGPSTPCSPTCTCICCHPPMTVSAAELDHAPRVTLRRPEPTRSAERSEPNELFRPPQCRA